MKKTLFFGALLVTMGIGAFSVYADSGSANEFNHGYGQMRDNYMQRNTDREIFTEEEKHEWFEERQAERLDHREERIQLGLSEGWITEEDAAQRRAEFAERDRLYEKNEFTGRNHHRGGKQKGYRQGRAYRCH